MRRARGFETAAVLVFAATMALAAPSPVQAHTPSQGSAARQPTTAPDELKQVRLDHSGQKRIGMASYYGRQFSGRQMADGTPMKLASDNAASRTLPLGTTAQVMNLRDGKTATVTIRDRGPYAKGRIIDVSPRTAQQLGIIKAGVTQVEVTPLTVPQPNGTVKRWSQGPSPRRPTLSAWQLGASSWLARFEEPHADPTLASHSPVAKEFV
jgi:rare lipoprotein A